MNVAKYAVVIVPLSEEDGGGFAAHVPDLPGCVSDGETQAEALVNVADAIDCWLETNEELGREVPEPGASVERLHKRDAALLRALKAAMAYADEADGRIAELEREIDQLIALADSGNGSAPSVAANVVVARIASVTCH